MKAMYVAEMRALEERAFASGETVLGLMERAGTECARLIQAKRGAGNRMLVFCGPGNNGGDGLVCARRLAAGNEVAVVLPAGAKTDAAKANLERAKREGVRIVGLGEAADGRWDVVVDSLLGIGARGALRSPIRGACAMINGLRADGAFVVSIDVPTGMDADTGECAEGAVRPDATICIHAPKRGEAGAGREASGELWVADIGLGVLVKR